MYQQHLANSEGIIPPRRCSADRQTERRPSVIARKRSDKHGMVQPASEIGARGPPSCLHSCAPARLIGTLSRETGAGQPFGQAVEPTGPSLRSMRPDDGFLRTAGIDRLRSFRPARVVERLPSREPFQQAPGKRSGGPYWHRRWAVVNGRNVQSSFVLAHRTERQAGRLHHCRGHPLPYLVDLSDGIG